MAIDNLKPGTRDIDVIVKDIGSHRALSSALEKCRYYMLQPQDLISPYLELSATALQNLDGFRWEIFVHYVAKKLGLTETIEQRGSIFYSGKLLTVFRLSREDIFLLKGMTERDRDLEDMSLLAKSGLNYKQIFDECEKQSDSNVDGHVWEALLNEKMKELERIYAIQVPGRKKLEKIAEQKMIFSAIKGILSDRSPTLDELIADLPQLGKSDIENALKDMISKGRVQKTGNGEFSLI